MSSGRGRSRAGAYAVIAVVTIAAGWAAGGGAGADEAANADIYARDVGGVLCFSVDPAATQCAPGEKADVKIEPGETVTWHFDGSTMPHNAAGTSNEWRVPEDGTFVTSGSFPKTFGQAGTYRFLCQVHPQMTGTVTVGEGGEPTPTPSPTPTPTPTPTPPPPLPPSGDHVETPAPSPRKADTVAPTVRSVRLQARRGGVRVRFRLSEPATVTVLARRRGSRTVVAHARVQARAGTRSVTLASTRLKKGSYTVEIQARDAFGNRSSAARQQVRLRS